MSILTKGYGGSNIVTKGYGEGSGSGFDAASADMWYRRKRKAQFIGARMSEQQQMFLKAETTAKEMKDIILAIHDLELQLFDLQQAQLNDDPSKPIDNPMSDNIQPTSEMH